MSGNKTEASSAAMDRIDREKLEELSKLFETSMSEVIRFGINLLYELNISRATTAAKKAAPFGRRLDEIEARLSRIERGRR